MTHKLFGGAFDINLPPNAVDASDIRQIPDNQEVFVHPSADQSLIIEILEHVDEPDQRAFRTHINELTQVNDSQEDAIQTVVTLPVDSVNMKCCSSILYADCVQNIAKFNESVTNRVNIHIVLFRLPQFNSDILFSFNDPVSISRESSSHTAEGPEPRWSQEMFQNAARSLTLQDPTIFGAGA